MGLVRAGGLAAVVLSCSVLAPHAGARSEALEVVGTVSLPGGAEIVAVSPSGRYAAVTQAAAKAVRFVDLKRGKLLKRPVVDVSDVGEPTSVAYVDDRALGVAALVALACNEIVFHKGSASHSDLDPRFIYNGYRSRLLFQQKHLPGLLFPIWKRAFVFYARTIERYRTLRRWRRLATAEGKPRRSVDVSGLDFAFAKAMADHGKGRLSEATLAEFEATLRTQKGQGRA